MSNKRVRLSDLDCYYIDRYLDKKHDKQVNNWFDKNKVKLSYGSRIGRLNDYIDYYIDRGYDIEFVTKRLVNIARQVYDNPINLSKDQLEIILLMVERLYS